MDGPSGADGAPTRGRALRRGRGVRTRGGRSSGSGRGRGGGERVGLGSRRPVAAEDPVIAPVESWPPVEPLEQALHSKRRRTWQPSRYANMVGAPPAPSVSPAPPAPPTPSAPPALSASPVPHASPAPAPLLETESQPPSPALYCEVASQLTPRAAVSAAAAAADDRRRRRPLHERDIDQEINFGSEPESGDDDDEDLFSQPFVNSRVIDMDTPEDPVQPDQLLDAPVDPELVTDDAASEVTEFLGNRPRSFFDFQWTLFPDNPIPPAVRREAFVHRAGPTTPCTDPYAIFVSMWDRQIMEQIATETNRYAQQLTQQRWESNNLHPTSRITKWQDTDADELYVFFALILGMGVVVKTRVEEYWNVRNDLFSTPGFSASMSFGRFTLLSKCLHFANNENMRVTEITAAEARLFKIAPVIDHLNKRFQELYTLDQNIALDESLMMWKGWLDINQFIRNKAAVVGVKTYEVCESQTGYLWSFDVHAHKNVQAADSDDPLAGITPQIVLKLIAGLEGRGHTLWMDNFYNSPALARKLKTLGFDCVGTLRTNRQFVPEALTKLTKGDMRVGDLTGYTSGDVDLLVFRDRNRVAMISTYHGNGVSVAGGVCKPIAIHDYNIMMGGVDKKDQMLAMYPIERKRTRIWYKKFFRRLLNVSVLNGYIIAKRSGVPPSLTHRSFRKELIRSLLSNHSNRASSSTPAPTPTSTRSSLGGHWLDQYPFTGSARQRRMCTVCRKKIQFFCVGCKKAVCMGCFPIMHQ